MNFESFESRIMDFREYSYIGKALKKIKQKRFQVKRTHMQMTTVSRNQFGLLNSKRFYLTDGVTSLPYGHFLLTSIREQKKQYKQIHKKYYKLERVTILQMRKNSYSSKYSSPAPTYYKLNSTKRATIDNIFNSTREYLLGGMWQ